MAAFGQRVRLRGAAGASRVRSTLIGMPCCRLGWKQAATGGRPTTLRQGRRQLWHWATAATSAAGGIGRLIRSSRALPAGCAAVRVSSALSLRPMGTVRVVALLTLKCCPCPQGRLRGHGVVPVSSVLAACLLLVHQALPAAIPFLLTVAHVAAGAVLQHAEPRRPPSHPHPSHPATLTPTQPRPPPPNPHPHPNPAPPPKPPTPCLPGSPPPRSQRGALPHTRLLPHMELPRQQVGSRCLHTSRGW